MSNFITGAYGAKATKAFNFNGVSRLVLVDFNDIASYAESADGTIVTGITLASGVTFSEVYFTKDSANLEDSYVDDGKGNYYMNQTLKFSALSEDIATTHKILLATKLVALIRRNNGEWNVVGKSLGLEATAGTKNISAEAGTVDITLAGKNFGLAAKVDMTDSALSALITSA